MMRNSFSACVSFLKLKYKNDKKEPVNVDKLFFVCYNIYIKYLIKGTNAMEQFKATMLEYLVTDGIRLVLAILLVAVGWIVTNKIVKALKNNQKIGKIDKTLSKFLLSFTNFAIKVLLVIIAATILGVDMSSIVAIVAALGVTVGLALQGGLANIAGGIIILLFKPFKVDEFIETNGMLGTVTDINLFYTIIKTIDNKVVYVPNSAASNGNITNYSREDLRRVDLEFSLEYGTNIDGVKALLLDIARKNEYTLDDPEASVTISALTDKEIKVLYRVWCNGTNYWDAYYTLNEQVKNGFEKFDVHIPYRQITVHYEKKDEE